MRAGPCAADADDGSMHVVKPLLSTVLFALAGLASCAGDGTARSTSSEVVAVTFPQLQEAMRPKAGETAVLVNIWATW